MVIKEMMRGHDQCGDQQIHIVRVGKKVDVIFKRKAAQLHGAVLVFAEAEPQQVQHRNDADQQNIHHPWRQGDAVPGGHFQRLMVENAGIVFVLFLHIYHPFALLQPAGAPFSFSAPLLGRGSPLP